MRTAKMNQTTEHDHFSPRHTIRGIAGGVAVLLACTAMTACASGASTKAAHPRTAKPTVASTPRPTALERTLQKRLDALTAEGVPGAVLLSRHGNTTTEVASGVTDVTTKVKTTTKTRFRTGSVAKTFVATVVLQLSVEHVLALDDTVEHWLPGMVPAGDQISIRELLGNRSGLFDFANDPRVLQPYLSGDLAHVWAPAALVSVATTHPANFEPGSGTLYSNTDYTVLGLIIEAATKQPVAREINTRIIEPLRLESTSVPQNPELTAPFAHGYFATKEFQDVTFLSPSMSSFGGNLVSTVDDLATFYDALFGGKLIPAGLVTQMRVATTSSTGEHLGLGLQVAKIPCGTFVGHSGSTPGYKAAAFTDLDHDRQFVILANSVDLNDRVGNEKAVHAFDDAVTAAACGVG